MKVVVHLLGTVLVVVDGQPVPVGGGKPRTLLARLGLSAPDTVLIDQLVESMWGADPPPSAFNTFHVHLSNLRRALAGAHPQAAQAVATRPGGYGLDIDLAAVDVLLFRRNVREARERAAAGDARAAAVLFRNALAMWRGEPLADLRDVEWAETEAHALGRERSIVETQWIDAELDAGNHLSLIPQLERAAQEDQLDEKVAGQLMLALYRAGRQTDALRVFEAVRLRLSDEIGLDPGPDLRELERRILVHDVALMSRPSASRDVEETTRVRPRSSDRATVFVAGRNHDLNDSVTSFGRRPDQDIVIDDEDVSRSQARIERRADRYFLVDLGSTNGTWLNGVRITETELRDGDEIAMGRTIITFKEREHRSAG